MTHTFESPFLLMVRTMMSLSLLFLFSACGGQAQSEPEGKHETADVPAQKERTTEATEPTSAKSSQQQQAIILTGDDNEMRWPTVIKFRSGKEVNILDIDPYKDYHDNVLETYEGGIERLFDLSNLDKTARQALLAESRINKDVLCKGSYLRLLTNAPRTAVSEGGVAISYHASIYCDDQEIIATQGYAMVYDTNGTLVSTIHDRKDGFYDIRLSDDGHYLSQKYGIDFGEGGEGQLEEGFRIYDTKNGELAFEWELGKTGRLQGYDFFRKSSFFTFFERDGVRHMKFMIDPDRATVLFKSMDLEQYSRDHNYRAQLFPNFIEQQTLASLYKDGFKKIN